MHVGLVALGDTAYTLDLANLLHDAGLSVSLYLSYAHVVLEVGTRDRPVEHLYELGLLPSACKVHLVRPPLKRNPSSVFLYYRLSKTIQKDGVDVVHVLAGPHELWLAILPWFLRAIPVICTMIVPRPNMGQSIPPFLSKLINKILAYGSDMVIVNGEDQIELVQKLYGIPIQKIAFVPLNARTIGINQPVRRNIEEPATILFFGAARLHKGLEYLIRAQPVISSQIPLARILISSRGEELQRCRKIIVDDSKFEIHEDYVSVEEMVDLFQRASLVVLPYLSASTSGVLMIAYSFGKPVVATKVGCLPEYVQNNVTGLLVDPANVEQLAEAIISLLSDNSMRRHMGENARKWVLAKNKDVARQTIKTYEKAMSIHASLQGAHFDSLR